MAAMRTALRQAWALKRNAKALVDPPTSAAHAAPLDGFRALAVLWVLVYHSLVVMPYLLSLDEANRQIYWAMVDRYVMRPFALGDFGVDIFFILSGILIMTILGRDMHDAFQGQAYDDPAAAPLLASAPGTGQRQLTNVASAVELPSPGLTASPPRPSVTRTVAYFFVRRYVRLMPAYALMIFYRMIWATVRGETEHACLTDSWRNFLFINNLFANAPACMSWTWSVALEWQMYMISPFVVYGVIRWPRWALHQVFALGAFSMLLYVGLTVRTFYADVSFGSTVYSKPYTRGFAYFFGMAIAVLIDRQKEQQRADVDADVAPMTFRRGVLRTLSILGALLVVYHDGGFGTVAWVRTKLVLTRPVFVASMAYVMYDALLPQRPGTDVYQHAVNRVLGSRPLYILAQVSYCVYLCHLFFVETVYGLLAGPIASGTVSFLPQWIFPVMTLFLLLLAFVTSVVVYFTIEKPANNLIADLLKSSKSKPDTNNEVSAGKKTPLN